MRKFEICHSDGGYWFRLKAGNGEIVATSEMYVSKQACLHGVESVRVNVGAPVEDLTSQQEGTLRNPKFQIFTDKAGKFRFRLCASNGEIIAASQSYTTKEGCHVGINSVKQNAPLAETVESEEK